MPIYKIDQNKKTKSLKRIDIQNEKELQNLIENNLEEIFGIEFLETEYSITNGRIDTLGIDENYVPVIIEYKKKNDIGAIIQGLFYLDWLKNNKKTIEMLVREKLKKENNVNWSLSQRLIIIAEAFDIKELSAINQINANVELKRYAFYGDMISIDDIKISRTEKYYKKGNDRNSQQNEATDDGQDITIEKLINKGNENIRNIIDNIRSFIFDYSDDIEERLTNTMICYYSNNKGLLWLDPSVKKIRIFLRKGEYIDSQNKINFNGWGGYPEFIINENEYNDKLQDYIKSLIKQAYDN